METKLRAMAGAPAPYMGTAGVVGVNRAPLGPGAALTEHASRLHDRLGEIQRALDLLENGPMPEMAAPESPPGLCAGMEACESAADRIFERVLTLAKRIGRL